MRTVPRVACINDLSGFGRCSLTTALPVLSVMGVQACPVPTAVLSKHTGFPQFSFTDLTDTLPDYFESWSDLDFDWIYAGFLGSLGQIRLVRQFFRSQKQRNPECRILLDPVMGDEGRRYSTYTVELCDAVRELVAEADVITPNITEACLLTGIPYQGECLHRHEAEQLAEQLMPLGCRAAVITGIVQENRICNLTRQGENVAFSSVHRTECLFSGTGDLFASVLCGALARGLSLPDAVSAAGDFLSEVTQDTLRQGTPAAEGVLFEPLLYQLGRLFHEKNAKGE
ncbi:MAG: pyridoxamine kinase [Oscillospiraceae bacterium]|nr:pyridoxamine kinase [Oscillospiraceae bacterium]